MVANIGTDIGGLVVVCAVLAVPALMLFLLPLRIISGMLKSRQAPRCERCNKKLGRGRSGWWPYNPICASCNFLQSWARPYSTAGSTSCDHTTCRGCGCPCHGTPLREVS